MVLERFEVQVSNAKLKVWTLPQLQLRGSQLPMQIITILVLVSRKKYWTECVPVQTLGKILMWCIPLIMKNYHFSWATFQWKRNNSVHWKTDHRSSSPSILALGTFNWKVVNPFAPITRIKNRVSGIHAMFYEYTYWVCQGLVHRSCEGQTELFWYPSRVPSGFAAVSPGHALSFTFLHSAVHVLSTLFRFMCLTFFSRQQRLKNIESKSIHRHKQYIFANA